MCYIDLSADAEGQTDEEKVAWSTACFHVTWPEKGPWPFFSGEISLHMEIVFVSAKEKAKACLSHNGAMACGMDQLEMLLHDAVKQLQLHAAAAAVVTTKDSSL